MRSLFKERVVVKQKTVYVPVEQRKRFQNLIAVVTGASGSIGSAIVRRLAVEGATVILTGRTAEKLEQLKFELEKDGMEAYVQLMDVTDADSVCSTMETIAQKHGKIDILVNNAGFSARTVKQPLHLQSLENIDILLNTNLRGPILTSRAVIPHMMVSKQGRIVNIGSIAGLQGKNQHAEYAAAKAGLFGLAKSQAIEVGKLGITVNCVSPGLVPREDASEEKLARFETMNYLQRICAPEDIANAVAFLCSEEASYITGQNICVDGGRSLGLRGD